MRRLLLALPLVLTACATPQTASTGDTAGGSSAGFDARAWLARARSTAVVSVEDTDSADPRVAAAHTSTAELDAAVGWTRACDTYWNPETQQTETESVEPGGGHYLRGVYTVTNVGPDEAVVAVTCNFGAYQGTYALVHVQGNRAALLVAPSIGMDGAPYGPPTAQYSTPSLDDDARSFTTFGRARGIGDCGLLSSYEITGFGAAEVVEVRARECDDAPENAPLPEDWPVVYPRP